MADGTKIEWTDATVNAINGCSVLSPGCTNCYAMRLAGTRMKTHPTRAGLTQDTKAGPVWTGEVRFSERALIEPLKWRRPRMIFWNAHGDTFHEKVPDEWIDKCFAVMALTPQHIHQVLTKRPERMRTYITALVSGERSIWQSVRDLGGNAASIAKLMSELEWGRFSGKKRSPLPNVWLGVSVEDQTRANERIPILLDTPATVRWLSCEPLLGPVDLTGVMAAPSWVYQPLRGVRFDPMKPPHYGDEEEPTAKIDWVVAGGESGPKARPMHPDWARSLRDQCASAGVPFHFKQWGEYRPCTDAELKTACGATLVGERPFEGPYMLRVGKKAAGRDLDGVLHDAFPEPEKETA